MRKWWILILLDVPHMIRDILEDRRRIGRGWVNMGKWYFRGIFDSCYIVHKLFLLLSIQGKLNDFSFLYYIYVRRHPGI